MAGLKEWFKQGWVDIGAKKKGGGFKKCGRKSASGSKRKDFRGPKPSKAMGGRIYKAGGGVAEAAAKLRRQGLGKGGRVCKIAIKGQNREAIGKNS